MLVPFCSLVEMRDTWGIDVWRPCVEQKHCPKGGQTYGRTSADMFRGLIPVEGDHATNPTCLQATHHCTISADTGSIYTSGKIDAIADLF